MNTLPNFDAKTNGEFLGITLHFFHLSANFNTITKNHDTW